MIILDSINELLKHIKEVQTDVISLSSESLMKMSSYIEKNHLEVDDDIAAALQYQDIISQQLAASMEAIEHIQNSIKVFNHAFKNDENLMADSMLKLQEKLQTALADAKDKKSRFAGKHTQDDQEEIEFF